MKSRLRILREMLGYKTSREMAKDLGLNPDYYKQMEGGHKKITEKTWAKIEKLAEFDITEFKLPTPFQMTENKDSMRELGSKDAIENAYWAICDTLDFYETKYLGGSLKPSQKRDYDSFIACLRTFKLAMEGHPSVNRLISDERSEDGKRHIASRA